MESIKQVRGETPTDNAAVSMQSLSPRQAEVLQAVKEIVALSDGGMWVSKKQGIIARADSQSSSYQLQLPDEIASKIGRLDLTVNSDGSIGLGAPFWLIQRNVIPKLLDGQQLHSQIETKRMDLSSFTSPNPGLLEGLQKLTAITLSITDIETPRTEDPLMQAISLRNYNDLVLRRIQASESAYGITKEGSRGRDR